MNVFAACDCRELCTCITLIVGEALCNFQAPRSEKPECNCCAHSPYYNLKVFSKPQEDDRYNQTTLRSYQPLHVDKDFTDLAKRTPMDLNWKTCIWLLL